MAIGVEARLRGSRRSLVWQEFFANSAHFPLANIFLELLVDGPSSYPFQPDLYLILFASGIQAWFTGSWRYQGTPRPLLGNLIGPAVYTALEFPLSPGFFDAPHHLAYWIFALAIGLIQQARLKAPQALRAPLLLAEHLVRTTILLAMYVILEELTGRHQGASQFLADPSHVFVATTVPMLGIVIGFAHLAAERHLEVLGETTSQLKRYSEWLLGRDRLSRAVDSPDELHLRRRERCVLFMDIRGFTRWSENHTPEEVGDMVNAYYQACEKVWEGSAPVKVKYTADELLLVYPNATEALAIAEALHRETVPLLASRGLGAGIGIHCGPLIEGLIGSGNLKNFDVLGDTVNTAKRLCSAAIGGGTLISDTVHAKLDPPPPAQPGRLRAKGKNTPLKVYLLEQNHGPPGVERRHQS